METKNSNIVHSGDQEFKKEVIDANIPVFVDFYATWCGPCKYFSNVLNEVAPSYCGKVKFVKVNVDESPEVASKMGVFSVPTLVFFKDGKVSKSMAGALPKEAFIKELEAFIA